MDRRFRINVELRRRPFRDGSSTYLSAFVLVAHSHDPEQIFWEGLVHVQSQFSRSFAKKLIGNMHTKSKCTAPAGLVQVSMSSHRLTVDCREEGAKFVQVHLPSSPAQKTKWQAWLILLLQSHRCLQSAHLAVLARMHLDERLDSLILTLTSRLE